MAENGVQKNSQTKEFINVRRLIGGKNPKLLKWLPGFVLRYLERIVHQKEINQFIIDHPDAKNEHFCKAVMTYFNVELDIRGIENIPKTGRVTLAMNHPLGGMDAMALVSGLMNHRTDLKFIVNDLLLSLEGLRGMFVGVNKHGVNGASKHQQIDDLFSSGSAICIFPAGLVSRKVDGKIRDLEWKKTFVLLSKKHDMPIVPIHINGELSKFFYRLSKIRSAVGIKANIEMLYLADEMFAQRNKKMIITIGKALPPSHFTTDKTDRDWAAEIRNDLYLHANN
jgi:1-acyl-sn-glycerol-3-phosphate acyltransferase